MLYLVATPIGNLADISYRAVEVLKTCDYILCEDTRHSLNLLKHYEIIKPLKSFHKFSEAKKESSILTDLKNGKTIALISDAGTPGIADPGQRLVKSCIEENIHVIAIPGACAAIQALCCSGMCTDKFQFLGFLPKKTSELQQSLLESLEYSGTTIFYESPKRLLDTLHLLKKFAPERQLAVLRELTKRYEEQKRGKAGELLEHFQNEVRGEIVLLIAGKEEDQMLKSPLSFEEEVKKVQKEYEISLKEAISLVAKMHKIPKRELYSKIHVRVQG